VSVVAIVDSGGANIASLVFALERLGARTCVTRRAEDIRAASRVILPGVGTAGAAMARLDAAGLIDCLRALEQPVLGICLGMQLLYERSEEGDTACLGVLTGAVRRLRPPAPLTVPHMGWNQLEPLEPDPLLAGIAPLEYFYFVHSFAASVCALTRAGTHHGVAFAAVVRRENFWGTQFHPERSGEAGARLLANFLRLE